MEPAHYTQAILPAPSNVRYKSSPSTSPLLVMLSIDGLRADFIDDPRSICPRRALRGPAQRDRGRRGRHRDRGAPLPPQQGPAGWIGEGGYDPILPFLPRLAVRQYVLELTIPVAGDFAILRRLPDDRKGSAAETPIDEAYAKLRNEAAAAALLRERHP
jgi:hypothetical protein